MLEYSRRIQASYSPINTARTWSFPVLPFHCHMPLKITLPIWVVKFANSKTKEIIIRSQILLEIEYFFLNKNCFLFMFFFIFLCPLSHLYFDLFNIFVATQIIIFIIVIQLSFRRRREIMCNFPTRNYKVQDI